MKRLLCLIMCISFSIPQIASSQHGIKFRGSDGWGLNGRYEQYFDKYNLQNFTGKISSIDTLTPIKEMAYGVQLKLKKDNKEHTVHLGPGWFVLFQDMNLGVNNDVEIRGCEVIMDNKPVIMAVYVKQLSKGRTLYLRDDDGVPYWCAWRRD